MLGNYSRYSCGPLAFFFQKESFRNTIRVTNFLVPDLVQPYVGHDLGPNLLQKFSVDIKAQLARKNPLLFPAVKEQ